MNFQRRQILFGAAGLALAPVVARAQAARTPFTLLNGKMFVDATVNGTPAKALVDSGSQFSGVDQAFAEAHGLKLGRRIGLRGIQGKTSGRAAPDLILGLGTARVAANGVALDYGRMTEDLGHVIEAVIGSDVFAAYVVDIDFDTMTLALHERARFQAPATARLIPLESFDGLMTAVVTVENGPPMRALIDLGNNVPLILSPEPARKSGLLDGRRSSTRRLSGHGPQSVAQVTTARAVSLGGERFADVPVLIPGKSVGTDANLGLQILWRFRLYLDYGGRRMWLGEPTGDRNAPFDRDYLGLETQIKGQSLKIIHVSPGSPAAGAGFKPGEVITTLNGSPATDVNMALGLSDQPGQTLELTLSNGVTRKVVLAAYY
jgi:predicted aspartyl protease